MTLHRACPLLLLRQRSYLRQGLLARGTVFQRVFDTKLTLSIPRKSLLLKRFHYLALEYFDTSAVYRGLCLKLKSTKDAVTMKKTILINPINAINSINPPAN